MIDRIGDVKFDERGIGGFGKECELDGNREDLVGEYSGNCISIREEFVNDEEGRKWIIVELFGKIRRDDNKEDLREKGIPFGLFANDIECDIGDGGKERWGYWK